ncbi:MAG: restriction endonuclease [Bacillota bacterium]
MALISNAEGRKDGGYTRLFGNDELGLLISRVQAAIITAGTELEKIIIEACDRKGMLISNLDAFLDTPHPEGVWVAPKKAVKKSRYSYHIEPDYLIFIHGPREIRACFIVELKDGDNFDTKKSAGEVANLKEFQNHIAAQIQYRTQIYICCFNAPNRAKVVEAFKHTITEQMALTGEEFCDRLGIDYEAILEKRSSDQAANMDYFARSLSRIPELTDRLKLMLLAQQDRDHRRPSR